LLNYLTQMLNVLRFVYQNFIHLLLQKIAHLINFIFGVIIIALITLKNLLIFPILYLTSLYSSFKSKNLFFKSLSSFISINSFLYFNFSKKNIFYSLFFPPFNKFFLNNFINLIIFNFFFIINKLFN
jgi:hypothetical protein